MTTDFKRYGWKLSEANLNTLPSSAPEEIKGLAKWLTLEGRRSSLEEWIGCVEEDGRIHGKFWNIGAWTHRMSHSAPNQANIASPFSGTPSTPVEEVKAKYDHQLRELFVSPEDAWLVGTDADGIQLRVLAHYMKSEDYVNAIIAGDKTKGTDIHSMNKRALGPICKTRDDAKTFIYAWLLGAGLPKIASILGCSVPQAKTAVANFLASLPELKRLKDLVIPRDARRGFFIGLDGRTVQQKSEHHMLAGYLQNGEAVIMKTAMLKWYREAKEEGINFEVVDFVHDEWQTIVYGGKPEAVRLGQLQRQALEDAGHDLGLYCPIAGSTIIGHNWKETH